jgi:pyroglutamyl-peptidase
LRVLATGFGPYASYGVNPSETLARAVGLHRAASCAFVAYAPLPVVYGDAAAAVIRAIRSLRADAVLALGLSPKSSHVRLERFAHNRVTSAERDGSGRVRAGAPILPGAPERLSGSLDPLPLSRALAAAGVPHGFSDDAGGYVCNDLYYRLLAARVPVIFVHVPADVSLHVARPLAQGVARSVRALVGSRR